jgi:hypothetical protein
MRCILCCFDDHETFLWLSGSLSLIFPPRRRIFQAWVTDAASVILEASQEDGKQARDALLVHGAIQCSL